MESHEIFKAAWAKTGLPLPYDISPVAYAPFIFSHSFAKAFWGDRQTVWKWNTDGVTPIPDKWDTIPAWQYHLQNMVLEENPLKYLEKFL